MRYFKDTWPFDGYQTPSFWKVDNYVVYKWNEEKNKWLVNNAYTTEELNRLIGMTRITEKEIFLEMI